MADGFHIELETHLAERLADAAARAGMTPAAFAASLIGEALDQATDLSESADASWEDDIAAIDEYERTGDAKPFGEVMDGVAARIRAAQDTRA